ncbi:hypothetical protein AGMMS49546_10530 [Spirochaetia bacterium]|nr:hypothetical protein AGMMS49546_10530 [Spirochaetia bacterium]
MIYKDEPKDANLLVVVAVEGYAQRHNMKEKDVFEQFKRYEINIAIRECYSTLHTQDLEETIGFAEDVLKRRMQ